MSRLFQYPELASAHGGRIDLLMTLVHGLMAAVFFIGLAVFFVALWRFRARNDRPARHAGPGVYAPFILAGFLLVCELALEFGISFPVRAAMKPDSLPEGGVEVRVVAQQYAWNVHYPGEDGEFGSTKIELIDDSTNPLGLDSDDPKGDDDIVKLNQLVMPVDTPVLVHLSSKDVVHSFNIPEMRVKQDAIPGVAAQAFFTPTMTTAEFQAIKGDDVRTFEIACAQLCGLGHASMRGYVRVLEPEAYAQWLLDNAPIENDEFEGFFE